MGTDKACCGVVQLRVQVNDMAPLQILIKAPHPYKGRVDDGIAQLRRNPKWVTGTMLVHQPFGKAFNIQCGLLLPEFLGGKPLFIFELGGLQPQLHCGPDTLPGLVTHRIPVKLQIASCV